MKRLDKLNEKDLLDERHFPVQALFNELYREQFLDTLANYICKGHGFGAEYGACLFPDDLDDYDIATCGMFEGVEFGLHNGEEILLDYPTFYYYLKKVCDGYIQDYPQEQEIISSLLNTFKTRYQIKS